jgi:hypothetical protein
MITETYDQERLHMNEVKDIIQENFASAKDAFEFFTKSSQQVGERSKNITKEVFKRGVLEMLPKRFV